MVIMLKTMLKPRELAEMLNVTTATSLRLRNEGKTPRCVKLISGIICYPMPEVEKFIKEHMQ